MKKYPIIIGLIGALVLIGLTAFIASRSTLDSTQPNSSPSSTENQSAATDVTNISTTTEYKNGPKDDIIESSMIIKISINNKIYKAILEDNATAQAFIATLPQEFTMQELNSNEKYVYLDHALPANPSKPNQIEAGDVMLYGDNCLVIFYKSFATSYSYTKIGHIDKLPILDSDDVTVRIENSATDQGSES